MATTDDLKALSAFENDLVPFVMPGIQAEGLYQRVGQRRCTLQGYCQHVSLRMDLLLPFLPTPSIHEVERQKIQLQPSH
jgi:hypothetical protein